MTRDGADSGGDAALALRLFAIAPRVLGGLSLRGAGSARDALVARLPALLPDTPIRRLAPNIDDERLLGGIDIAASLALGQTVAQRGLLAEAAGGVLLVPLAERLSPAIAGRLAQARDGGTLSLILLDDGVGIDEQPPAALLERVAFVLDLTGVRSCDDAGPMPGALALDEVEAGDDEALAVLAGTATALGVGSVRALLFALAAARAHAALAGSRIVRAEDLRAAARLVLAPRATRMPEPDQPPAAQQPEASHDQTEGSDDADQGEARPSPDQVLDAALAAIPPDLLARLAEGAAQRSARSSGGGGKARSKLRGKPLGARPGMPRGGARLALIDTLRAAVPWQPLRRREAGGTASAGLLVRKGDLRVRRFEERAAAVTVFCVDASGSAAMARLAEAKGAVELMLAQAYVARSEVALVAFRGSAADLLLPPTRSLTRARRALAELPGGGGTPLASGIIAARKLAEAVAARGNTAFLVFLTDGSANVAADGSPGRTQARADAQAAAKAVASTGLAALVLDIAPRPRPEAEALARTMHARYLPLPLADAYALRRTIEAARPSRQPA